MTDPRFLITGAHGCVGAWVAHELVKGGHDVVTFDLSAEPRRLRLLLGGAVASIPHVIGDITDLAALERTIDEYGVSHMIHLAALQVPLVRSDPPQGARVNVVGTTNVFEAASRYGVEALVYASSVAAYDLDGTLLGHPSTLYGVFKRANEAMAEVYYTESGVSSVGLRPHTVYGVGRDQGLTSAPTTAMLAAAAGMPYAIPYGGVSQLQFAQDVARAFIAASLSGVQGATVHNLPGDAVPVADLVSTITALVPDAEVTHEETILPFPAELDARSFVVLVPDYRGTPLVDGVRMTIDRFRELLERGTISAPSDK